VNAITADYCAALMFSMCQSGGAAAAAMPSLGKMAKDMVAFTIIDSFLNAWQPVTRPGFWPKPLEIYSPTCRAGNWAITTCAQGGGAAATIDMVG
jgi:hypothetical protein